MASGIYFVSVIASMNVTKEKSRKFMAAALLAAAAAGLVLERTHILVRAAEKGASAQLAYTENIAGGQWSQDHYSPLSQINRRNVKSLKVAWVFHTHEAGDGMETNPLVVGRVIYAYTPSQKVIALNAVTGELLWEFDSGIKGSQPVRGVAYWTDGKRGLVLAGIMNYLYCLDATTGKPVLSFGESGRIDLRKGLGRDYRQQSIVLTSPGVIF
jgi:glucose dehydrogenase